MDLLEVYPDVEDRSPSESMETDPLLGNPQKRRELEKSLLRKLDLRAAFLVLLYMINYASLKSLPHLHLERLSRSLDGQSQRVVRFFSAIDVKNC